MVRNRITRNTLIGILVHWKKKVVLRNGKKVLAFATSSEPSQTVYSSGQKSRPQRILVVVGPQCLKMCVHILRQECRSQAQFCFDCFSIKRIMVDVLIFVLSFYSLKTDCLLNFALLFTKCIINFRCFCMELMFSLWPFLTDKTSSFARILAFSAVSEYLG